MKKCTYCGKEYSDDAKICAFDEQPLRQIGPQTTALEPEADTSAVTNPGQNDAVRIAASRNMKLGGFWCLGGIAVTVITYNAASGGGTYVVAWGAILFGAIRFFRGLLAWRN